MFTNSALTYIFAFGKLDENVFDSHRNIPREGCFTDFFFLYQKKNSLVV